MTQNLSTGKAVVHFELQDPGVYLKSEKNENKI